MSHVPKNVKKKLLDYPFVTAVGSGYGRGERHENGEKAAVAFVTEKKPESELDEEQILPKEIDGWKVDVQPVGSIGIEPIQPDKVQDTGEIDTTATHRPAPAGVSIGHPQVTAGTGFTLWGEAEENGVKYPAAKIVSNNHVAANENDASSGDFIIQPGSYDGGTKRENKIGELEDFIKIEDEGNTVDLAWASVEDRKVNSYIPSIGVPTETGEVSEDDVVKKFGRTTGLKKGKVLSTDAVIRVKYGSGVKEFEDQVICESISAGGDSGSAVVDENGELVGLLFAGSDRITVFNKIGNVLEKSGLYLNPEEVYK